MRSLHLLFLLLLSSIGSAQDRVMGRVEIVEAARSQIGKTIRYSPDYMVIDYPGGDIPLDSGVCTDVVVRALRQAFQFDLQKQVHQDMKAHFSAYPAQWGLKRPDRNIDHRRVPNLATFFKRRGLAIPITDRPEDYQPGDIVTCTVPPHLPHIMIVSDRKTSDSCPFVIHNIGAGTREDDCLFDFPITGHFRFKVPPDGD
ncbi:hypothetical protein HNR46_000556 [Haloferula luteola]|uniref:DUF1287 domain-containing protein n=1 Tax=Haloferula luteola TaxID=595692 RepID=A0A840UX30_9BACT|nr:DUF1287 domain-containing protein [Haloferula luteola]MBB5350332.1 hypothetical protein [Haloferula luteola]